MFTISKLAQYVSCSVSAIGVLASGLSSAANAATPHLHCDVIAYTAPVVTKSWLNGGFTSRTDPSQSFFGSTAIDIGAPASAVSNPPQTPPCLYEISDVTQVLVKFIFSVQNPPVASITFDATGINNFVPPPVTFLNEKGDKGYPYTCVQHQVKPGDFDCQITFNAVDNKADSFIYQLTNFTPNQALKDFPIDRVEFTISGNHYYLPASIPEPSFILGLIALGIFGTGSILNRKLK